MNRHIYTISIHIIIAITNFSPYNGTKSSYESSLIGGKILELYFNIVLGVKRKYKKIHVVNVL